MATLSTISFSIIIYTGATQMYDVFNNDENIDENIDDNINSEEITSFIMER
jgi:hypothetical protein